MRIMWRWLFLSLFLIGCITTSFAKKACAIPFDLEAKLILVTAQIDGQEGYFILDTGAPTLLLNATHFEGVRSDLELAGLQEAIPIEEKVVRHFQWNCLRKQQLTALVLDLSHLEERINKPLLGLIGYEVLKDWHILFDYTQQQIELYKGNDKDLYGQQTVLASVPFQLQEHLVTLEMTVAGQAYQLIIDSGSGSNLLNSAVTNPALLPLEEAVLLRSADQEERLYRKHIAEEASIADVAFFNQVFLPIDLENLTQNIDGLLGFPFLSCCKISIDYRKGKIMLWKEDLQDLAVSN